MKTFYDLTCIVQYFDIRVTTLSKAENFELATFFYWYHNFFQFHITEVMVQRENVDLIFILIYNIAKILAAVDNKHNLYRSDINKAHLSNLC